MRARLRSSQCSSTVETCYDVGRDGDRGDVDGDYDGGDVDGDYDDSDVDAVQCTGQSQAKTKTETKAKY